MANRENNKSIIFLWIIAVSVVQFKHAVGDVDFLSPGDDAWLEKQSVELFLQNFDREYSWLKHKSAVAEWNYNVNLTAENQNKRVIMTNREEKWLYRKMKISKTFNTSPLLPRQRRQMQLLRSMLIYDDLTTASRLSKKQMQLQKIYGMAMICLRNGTCIGRGEDIMPVYEKSDDFEFLKEMWTTWRNKTGRLMKKIFVELIDLKNIVARQNGYKDMGEYERANELEDVAFDDRVTSLYSNIRPLYRQLHGYVRHRLRSKYPGRIDEKEPLPAHVIRNMWAQSWENLYEDVKPYKTVQSDDLTAEMRRRKGWTLHRMVKESEKFYVSLGFEKMTPSFWENSIFKKPRNRKMECHASAFDFYDRKDFRISMCGHAIASDLFTIHHEMGHIVYYMSYRHLPILFHDSPNAGFHEAIGDTIYLSVQTTKHLHKLGLLKSDTDSYEARINQLMLTALDKIMFFPFALAMESWMWGVYNGSITPDHYNEAWWKLKRDLQGLKPPVARSEADFDPGSKYHIAAGFSYIRYFISYLLQFQFYEAMCKESGHTGPLDQCDFYGSKSAGHRLRNMLVLGKSHVWPYALKQTTGKEDYDTSSVLKYFEPLYNWLIKYNRENRVRIGW